MNQSGVRENKPPNHPNRSNAARYWDQVLDPQNLERGDASDRVDRLSLEDEIRFAQTPDLEAAAQWMNPANRPTAWMIDLGAGLGANSFAFARGGLRVLAADTSLKRLRALRRRAREVGCEHNVVAVVAAAEALPFATGSVPAIATKSVLIHTDLPRAAAELARVLTPGGRAALIEPQPGNPFARFYRRWMAPRSWRAITRYFDPQAQEIFIEACENGEARDRVAPFYLFSFLAFVFQYLWPWPGVFHFLLRHLHRFDAWLFRRFPSLARWAWFGLIRIEKSPEQPKSSWI